MAAALTLQTVIPDLLLTDYLVIWAQPPTSTGRTRPNKRWRRLLQRTNVIPTSNSQLINSWTPVYGDLVAGQRIWIMVQVVKANGCARSVPRVATCIVT